VNVVRYKAPGGIERLGVVRTDDPGAPGPNEIRVRIHGSSLNGHDYNVALGILPVGEGRVLMSDGAGEVEAVGSDVTEFAFGDHVVSTFFPDWQRGDAPRATFARTPGDGIDGYAAEVVVRPANFFTRMPQNWNFMEAATLPTAGLTAWRAIEIVDKLEPHRDVLVLGTGGVSIFALQFAKSRDARVIVTSSSDEKLERARAIGADFGVNYRLHQDWSSKVMEWTGGRGVDLVVETGGPGTLPESMKATRIGGDIVLVGVLTGIQGQIPTAALMGRQQTLHGITVGSTDQQKQMIDALDTMSLRPVTDSCFPLNEIRDAFRLQESNKHFGKICLNY
jgi:NADPH:quinone reductase-like Zn-dependent oxidoreductase